MNRPSYSEKEIEALGRKYFWWDAVAGKHSPDRIIAQITNLGTYDDLQLLERMLDRSRLIEVMRNAQPGWFSHRSWEFWRSRLMHRTGASIPDTPPTRAYDAPDTLIAVADHGAGPVKLSFFGGIAFGRVDDPLWTDDGVLLVASLDDLMATKLKATQDRAEAKDYRDIATMIASGVSLAAGLGAVRNMFGGEPAQVLRALGYFKDGDLADLDVADRAILKNAINSIDALPDIEIRPGLVPKP